jgi:hypothetical protein
MGRNCRIESEAPSSLIKCLHAHGCLEKFSLQYWILSPLVSVDDGNARTDDVIFEFSDHTGSRAHLQSTTSKASRTFRSKVKETGQIEGSL